MSQFYEIDSTRISHEEYWWGTRSPLVIIGWLTKWLHLKIPGSTDDPNTDSTIPFVVESLPPEVAAHFDSLTRQLIGLGFLDPVYHLIADAGTHTTIYWATFRHGSGSCFARIHQRVWHRSARPSMNAFPIFFTEFDDGTFLVSSSGKPDVKAPETVQMNRMPNAALADLWATHQKLVGEGNRKAIAGVQTREDLIQATERHHILVRDYHLARGVFRTRSGTEQAKADAFAATIAQAQASGSQHPEVLAQLEKLQETKGSWATAIWILIGSIVLFIAAGVAQWQWKFTLWIIPALLLHEGGHWVAMRIFKYRNLRMFFIPLFGAAVVGRHWNVPGWKKALVSLAGPLPGIIVGVLLAILALVLKKPGLNQAAIILLVLNGLNLLPLLPLDGGHVLHAVLFCRNRWLDVAFRVVTVIGLFALSLALGRIFMFLAIAMAVSLPLAFKIAQVTDNLRKTPMPPPVPGEDRIPRRTAETIIDAIKATVPKGLSSKALAQQTISVYETLNARPPGVLGTIGLLILHGGGFFIAILAGVLLVVAAQGNMRDFFSAASRQPPHDFQCGSSQSWVGLDQQETDSVRNTLVVSFNRHSKAAASFGSLTNHLPSSATLMLFGESLLLTLPANDDAAREKWFDELQTLSTNIFVTVSNRGINLDLVCIAPTAAAATNITRELKEYFAVSGGMNLTPPWSVEASRPGFNKFRRARADWKSIGEELAKVWNDPALKEQMSKISAASRRGSRSEVTRLQKEEEELRKELTAKAWQQLRNSTSKHDPELVDLNDKLSHVPYTNRVERAAVLRQVAAKLGESSRNSDAASSQVRSVGADYGNVSQHGLLIEMRWVSLHDAEAGLPALTTWLCERHCISMKYALWPAFMNSLNDEYDDER